LDYYISTIQMDGHSFTRCSKPPQNLEYAESSKTKSSSALGPGYSTFTGKTSLPACGQAQAGMAGALAKGLGKGSGLAFYIS
jgi:hypothetical protein